jgi:hypothetical protein
MIANIGDIAGLEINKTMDDELSSHHDCYGVVVGQGFQMLRFI